MLFPLVKRIEVAVDESECSQAVIHDIAVKRLNAALGQLTENGQLNIINIQEIEVDTGTHPYANYEVRLVCYYQIL